MIAEWHSKYIGIPYKWEGRDQGGCDCYGLCRLIYMEEYGILLPAYEGYNPPDEKERAIVASVIFREMAKLDEFDRVDPPPKIGDGFIFRIGALPVHCGIYVGEEWMINIQKGTDACLSRYKGPKWASRLEGIYRHRSLQD